MPSAHGQSKAKKAVHCEWGSGTLTPPCHLCHHQCALPIAPGPLPSLHIWTLWPLSIPYLDGFHWVILVQFVDVVSDAGVERGRCDGVDDGGIVGLLLVPLAVGVDEEREKAAQDGAAQPHSDHVEHVELWEDSIESDATLERNMLCQQLSALVKRERWNGKPHIHSKLKTSYANSFEIAWPPKHLSKASTVYFKIMRRNQDFWRSPSHTSRSFLKIFNVKLIQECASVSSAAHSLVYEDSRRVDIERSKTYPPGSLTGWVSLPQRENAFTASSTAHLQARLSLPFPLFHFT